MHNDVKPNNIFLTQNGSPRISDYGLTSKINAPFNKFIGTQEYLPLDQSDPSATHLRLARHRDYFGVLASVEELLFPPVAPPDWFTYEFLSPGRTTPTEAFYYSAGTLRTKGEESVLPFADSYPPFTAPSSRRLFNMLSSLTHSKGGLFRQSEIRQLLDSIPQSSGSEEATGNWYKTLVERLLVNSAGIDPATSESNPIYFGTAELGAILFTDQALADSARKTLSPEAVAFTRRIAERAIASDRKKNQEYIWSKYGSPYLLPP